MCDEGCIACRIATCGNPAPAACWSPAITSQVNDDREPEGACTMSNPSANPSSLDNVQGDTTTIDDERLAGLMGEHPLIGASNRGAVTFTEIGNGQFSARPGSGGLVTAIRTGHQAHDAIWTPAPETS